MRASIFILISALVALAAACADVQPEVESSAEDAVITGGTVMELEPTPMLENEIEGVAPSYGPEPSPLLAPGTITSGQNNEFNDQFGTSVLIADFDGDGRGDLAIGVPFEDVGSVESAGQVLVYRGTASGLVFSQSLTQSGIGSNDRFDHFGHSLAAGDFDGDGRIDLAIGAPEESPGTDPSSGAVFVLRGSAAGLVPGFAIVQPDLGNYANEVGDRFGHALTAADFNGDGRDDLAIGAPGEMWSGTKAGAVYLALGAPSGVTGGGIILQDGISTPIEFERFGSALASGNFLGSARAELVVGCYNEVSGSTKPGAVFVYQWLNGALSPWKRYLQDGLNEEGDAFGKSLAVGNFDGDLWDDLAIGTPGENRHRGAVYLIRGTGSGMIAHGVLRSDDLPETRVGDRFGVSLAVGDINNDGRDDLVVGAPRATNTDGGPRVGRAVMYFGSADGLNAIAPLTQDHFNVGDSDDGFGVALAIGDLGNDGRAEIAVGAPKETVGLRRAGAAYVFRGLNNALPTAWKRIVQASP